MVPNTLYFRYPTLSFSPISVHILTHAFSSDLFQSSLGATSWMPCFAHAQRTAQSHDSHACPLFWIATRKLYRIFLQAPQRLPETAWEALSISLQGHRELSLRSWLAFAATVPRWVYVMFLFRCVPKFGLFPLHVCGPPLWCPHAPPCYQLAW
jgi:hypothetical protein